jgi:hypothetical protein
MEEIWNDLISREKAVRLDTSGYEAVMYQGVKAVKDENGIILLSTENDYYPRVSEQILGVFLEKGVDAGIKAFKKDRYLRHLEEPSLNNNTIRVLNEKIKNL